MPESFMFSVMAHAYQMFYVCHFTCMQWFSATRCPCITRGTFVICMHV